MGDCATKGKAKSGAWPIACHQKRRLLTSVPLIGSFATLAAIRPAYAIQRNEYLCERLVQICPKGWERCAMPKRSPKTNRRSKALPALVGFGVSLSMASGACTSTSEASAHAQNHEIFLAEEEISDVSLATFYVFDKEHAGPPPLSQKTKAGRRMRCGLWL
jgi:hypothetical protein